MPDVNCSKVLPDNFFSSFYEREPCLWQNQPACIPMVPEQAYDFLFRQLHRDRDLDILKNGQISAPDSYRRPDGFMSPAGLVKALHSGYTIRVRNVERLSQSFSAWSLGLGTELRACVKTNMYVSPAGSSALRAHADGHDVIIYQVFGEKSWFVAAPIASEPQLPVESQAGERSEAYNYKSLTLAPGSMYYLPRGHVHCAKASTGLSIHLTMGIQPVRWHDLMLSILESTTLGSDVLRRSVRELWGDEQGLALGQFSSAMLDPGKVEEGLIRAFRNLNNEEREIRLSWKVPQLNALAQSLLDALHE